MYYNVVIEIDEKDDRGNFIVARELDNKNLDNIKKNILIPYLKRQNIFIDDQYIEYKQIRKINIFQTHSTTEIIRKIAHSRSPKNSLISYTKYNVINDRFMTNITKETLTSIGDMLKKDEKDKIDSVLDKNENNTDISKVFIVHGRNNEIKIEIARFIENLGLKAIILDEQSNNGKTIIEKIEQHTNVGYGIVIYTPCDKGGKADQNINEYKLRARQNVLFEHGYLLAKLGRNRVSAVIKQGIEIPSDISGLVYIEHDNNNGWKLAIAKDLAIAGYSIDISLLLNN